jgi:hypothetical protein
LGDSSYGVTDFEAGDGYGDGRNVIDIHDFDRADSGGHAAENLAGCGVLDFLGDALNGELIAHL